MLENIKLLLGIDGNEKDRLLQILIKQAMDEAKEITGRSDICGLNTTIEKMVVYNFNRLGSEGVASEGYSGVSFSYTTDYPDSIMRVLKKYRKIKTI